MDVYSASAATTLPTRDMLQFAITALANNGFAIVDRDDRSASLEGPGLKSTRQNPLLGASTIRLTLDDHQLRLDAELGGVATMRRFLLRFPVLLGLGLGLFFSVVGGFMFGRQFGVGFGVPWAQGWTWVLFALASAMLPVTPWLFLSPMISFRMRGRTQTALDTLVKNAVRMVP